MFFTHNMQYSLLLLIHVKVQCDLAITKFTCVNVCSLNCLDLFLKYKFGLVCVCVCVCLGFMCLKIIVERWFWKFKMLFGSLVELHALLHLYLCFSLLEKLFLSYLDTSSTPLNTWLFYWDLQLIFIAILTPLDS